MIKELPFYRFDILFFEQQFHFFVPLGEDKRYKDLCVCHVLNCASGK